MKNFIKYIKLFFLMIYYNVKANSMYSVNFIVGILQTFVATASSIAIIWIVLDRFKDIAGWSFYELGFMYAIAKLSMASVMMFFSIVWVMDRLINMGTVDRLLVRPKSPLFLFVFQKFDIMWLSDILTDCIILIYAGSKAGINWSAINILFLIVVIASSILIIASILFIAGTSAFWVLKSSSLKDFVNTMFYTFMPYPVSIYGKRIQYGLSFIIPFAFVYYYPSLHFFNKSDNIFPNWIAYCSPIIALTLVCLSVGLWQLGLKSYKSAGN